MLPDSVVSDVSLDPCGRSGARCALLLRDAAVSSLPRSKRRSSGAVAVEGVQSIAETLNRSHVAMVYFDALQEFRTAHECVSAEQAVEAARRGARTARNRMHEQLRQGLSYLSAIAITAPLVGLFGTTIGILDSFGAYIGSRNGFIAFITANLADALVPTAAGLLVGVLATWCFNFRNDRLATFDVEMEISELDLVKRLEQQRRAGKL